MSISPPYLARFYQHPDFRVSFAFLFVFLPVISWSLEKVETYHPGGAIRERFFIAKNDSGESIKDSIYREFHPNGKKKTEIRYRSGQEDGIVRLWYNDGTLEMICHYENGKPNGEKTGWHSSGAMKLKSAWSMGSQTGLSETWFENGHLQSQGNYCNGKRCAEFRTWYENGQLRSLISFKDGYFCGPAKWYHSNGELAIVGYHGDYGDREFLWQLYRDNGEKCAQISYSAGIVEKKEYFAPDAVIDSMFRTIEKRPEK